MLRFDADLGVTGDEVDRLYSVDRDQLNVMAAWVEGRRLAGLVDFKAGRFLRSDAIDFLLLDGASALVRTPWYFGVELLVGLEAKHDTNPVTTSQQELDGVRFIEGRLATANDAATVALGAALTTVDLRDTRAWLGYRRLLSDGQVDQEKIGLALYQRLVERLHLSLNGSYDLYTAQLDQLRVTARVDATDWLGVEGQFVRLLPVFDADSIFNIFAAEALNDANLRLRLHLSDRHRLVAGAMVRFFGNEAGQGPQAAAIDEVVRAYGAMAGWSYGLGHSGRVGVDVSWESGYGGTRVLADVAGMVAAIERQLEFDARLTLVHFDEDLLANLNAVSFGYQVGARYLVSDALALMLVAEHNINRLQTHQFRLRAVVDLNVFL
jgi:hypothetical protein